MWVVVCVLFIVCNAPWLASTRELLKTVLEKHNVEFCNTVEIS
jgi:hypothetical protein